jgi:hypothetical protein
MAGVPQVWIALLEVPEVTQLTLERYHQVIPIPRPRKSAIFLARVEREDMPVIVDKFPDLEICGATGLALRAPDAIAASKEPSPQ